MPCRTISETHELLSSLAAASTRRQYGQPCQLADIPETDTNLVLITKTTLLRCDVVRGIGASSDFTARSKLIEISWKIIIDNDGLRRHAFPISDVRLAGDLLHIPIKRNEQTLETEQTKSGHESSR